MTSTGAEMLLGFTLITGFALGWMLNHVSMRIGFRMGRETRGFEEAAKHDPGPQPKAEIDPDADPYRYDLQKGQRTIE